MSSSHTSIEVRLITLGDSHVGKSSIIIRFTENEFSSNYMSTVGFDLKYKIMKIKDEEVKIMIYDTAGQERFRSLATNYLKKADGILLVYDISERQSFENIGKWMNNIVEETDKKVPIILVGNKSDLEQRRTVKKEEGVDLAKSYNILFYETNCVKGENIENCFIEITSQILEKKNKKKERKSIKQLDKYETKKAKKECC